MRQLTDERFSEWVETLTQAQLEKARYGQPESAEDMIRQAVTDTLLTADGAISIEAWRDPEPSDRAWPDGAWLGVLLLWAAFSIGVLCTLIATVLLSTT